MNLKKMVMHLTKNGHELTQENGYLTIVLWHALMQAEVAVHSDFKRQYIALDMPIFIVKYTFSFR